MPNPEILTETLKRFTKGEIIFDQPIPDRPPRQGKALIDRQKVGCLICYWQTAVMNGGPARLIWDPAYERGVAYVYSFPEWSLLVKATERLKELIKNAVVGVDILDAIESEITINGGEFLRTE